MSSSVNLVTLLGYLGGDPDPIKDGIAFNVATSEKWTDDAGHKQERTDWHRVILFGKRAAALAKILHKSSRVCIQGALRSSKWTDDTGATRYNVDVLARDVVLLDPAPESTRNARRAGRDDGADHPAQNGGAR